MAPLLLGRVVEAGAVFEGAGFCRWTGCAALVEPLLEEGADCAAGDCLTDVFGGVCDEGRGEGFDGFSTGLGVDLKGSVPSGRGVGLKGS